VKPIALTAADDARGLLVAAQFPEQLPFAPERTFIISQSPVGVVRGGHAHRVCHQVLIAVGGRVKVEWDDDDGTQTVVLDNASTGLHIPPLAWAQQTYLDSACVLVALASHQYDVNDYVDDRAQAGVLREQARLKA